MPNLDYLYRLLGEYQEFKSSLSDILANMKNSLEPLELASRDMRETFLYDDDSADDKNIINNRNKINNLIISIEQNILPAINQSINRINRQIADAEMAQALSANL